ncbi:MAG: DMT family transporter [Thermoplasmatota archaeon]
MESRSAAWLTAFCALIWGGSFLVNDDGLRAAGLDPAVFTFWRFAIAAVVAVIAAVALKQLKLRVFGEPIVWGLAALSAIAFLLQYVGQGATTPARAALFVNANVITVAILSWIVLRQRPTIPIVLAMFVALAGVVLLQLRSGATELAEGTWQGDLITFLCGAAGAGFFVLYKPALRRANVASLSVAIFSLTALLVAPFALLGSPSTFVPTARGWLDVAYTGVFASALAYWLWGMAMEKLTPTASAIILLLEVAVAAAISVAIGRENFTLVTGIGALLLVLGVSFLNLPQRSNAGVAE